MERRPEVNHLDGDPGHNCVPNLEYTTHGGNMAHAAQAGLLATGSRHGSQTHPQRIAHGDRLPQSKLDSDWVHKIRQLRERGWSHRRIAGVAPVSAATIGSLLRGETWTHVF